MRFSALSLAAAAAAAAGRGVAAINVPFRNGLLSELTSLNLTALAGIVGNMTHVPAGPVLLNNLASGHSYPVTLLAPTNDAWAGVNPYFSGDLNWTAPALAYHIIPEYVNLSTIARSPSTSVYPTMLTNWINGQIVWLASEHQNINLTLIPKQVIVSNQDKYFPVVLSTHTYQKLRIIIISSVVDLPPGLYQALHITTYPWASNLTTLVTSAPPDVLTNITNTPNMTFFAPTNQAFLNAGAGGKHAGKLPSFTNGSPKLNSTEWTNLVKNHAIFKRVVFSGKPPENYTSAAGEMITVSKGGAYGHVVSCKGRKANIIRADIITQSGVLHIIDAVLPNLSGNATRAVML